MDRNSIAFILVLIPILSFASGCGTTRLPTRLNSAESALIQSVHFPFTVGVKRYKYPVYSDKLVSSLRATGLFDNVDYLDRIDELTFPPHLVAEVAETYTSDAVFPFFTIMTLGIIPTPGDEKHGHVFFLSSRNSPENKILIEFREEGYTILGWLATFLNISPNWTLDDVRTHKRFYDRFSLILATHSNDISRVAGEQ